MKKTMLIIERRLGQVPLKLALFVAICLANNAAFSGDTPRKLLEKGFSQEWIDSLTLRGTPRFYQGEELRYIGLIAGGQYAGQVYLGGDGRLWYWDIFNQRVMQPGGAGDRYYNKPFNPDEFRAVNHGFIADWSQDDGKSGTTLLDGRGFSDVRFRGEYPIGVVDLSDPALPLQVRLECFSPFIPTNSDDSGIPATLLSYTVSNVSQSSIEFRIGGWLEHASHRSVEVQEILEPVTSPLQGVVGRLVTAKKRQPRSSSRADIVVQDFEAGYGDWTTAGQAFSTRPFLTVDQRPWQPLRNVQGSAIANSHNTIDADSSREADAMTGTLTSPAFRLSRGFLAFRVSGGNHKGKTEVRLLIDDQVVGRASGRNDNNLRPHSIDVRPYVGKLARIEIADEHTGAWGLVSADDFRLTDDPSSGVDLSQLPDAGQMAIALLKPNGQTLEELPKAWKTAIEAGDQQIPDPSQALGAVQTDTIRLKPGESSEVRLTLCWFFPNTHRGDHVTGVLTNRENLRNYYHRRYKSAAEVAQDLGRRHETLTQTTRNWRDTWYDSSLPYWFLDRTFLNASTLATTACLRFNDLTRPDLDGRVYFWEGTYLGRGTCTHVTHYEQAFGRLFPEAARAQRAITDWHIAWRDKPSPGFVGYRAEETFGHHFGIPHAIDGACGTILRTWREHTTSTDQQFLESVWPKVKQAVRFIIDQDAGRGFFVDKVSAGSRNGKPDGILEGPQYHTLDKYWTGKIPWHSSMYLAALRAAAAMAEDMNDKLFAKSCRQIAEQGFKNLPAETFDSELGYFVQKVEADDDHLVNTNRGCHIDQLLGESWAIQVGLPDVVPRELIQSASSKLFEHNFFSELSEHRENTEIPCVRFYADDDEPGFVICSFPDGGAREAVPKGTEGWDALVVGYFSECMTGFTYMNASQMIAAGEPLEGLALCRAIHDRYAEAPLRRNPFNEIEYGNHYTRAMSSYAAYVAACGFTYHGPKGSIGFAPKISPKCFRAAFTTAAGWGSYTQNIENNRFVASLQLRYGKLVLRSIRLDAPQPVLSERVVLTTVEGKEFEIGAANLDQTGAISLTEELTLNEGDELTIQCSF